MKKRIPITQTIICVAIICTVYMGQKVESPMLTKAIDRMDAEINRVMTGEDVLQIGKKGIGAVKLAPAAVFTAVIDANRESEYGSPIDKESDGVIKAVHAVSGGMVLGSGIDSTIGLYVKIRHDEAVSVYGNLSDINVTESERVVRGEIIGSYDSTSGTEFYYALEELN